MPDYTKILEVCGDPSFGRYAKEELTQHQFTFDAVEVSEHFPFGVKVMYRAYSRDKVIELVKGQHPNYKDVYVSARSVDVTSFPKLEDRPEGMYLLRSLPQLRKEDVSFQDFTKGGRADFDACITGVKNHFGSESTEYKDWLKWENDYIPKDDDVKRFCSEHPEFIKLPLFNELFAAKWNEGMANQRFQEFAVPDDYKSLDEVRATDCVTWSQQKGKKKPRRPVDDHQGCKRRKMTSTRKKSADGNCSSNDGLNCEPSPNEDEEEETPNYFMVEHPSDSEENYSSEDEEVIDDGKGMFLLNLLLNIY